jgi:hypothetical protein
MGKAFILLILSLFLVRNSYSQCEIVGQVFYGNPLEKGIGATIREKETKTGVLAGKDGYFSYSGNVDKKFTITFSYENMEPVEYVFDASKYSSYKIKVILYPKAKSFKKQQKSYVTIKEKIKKPIPPIDNQAPDIYINSVDENSEISTINGQMMVYGRACDNSEIKEVLVNETKVKTDNDGNFQYTAILEPGTNTITVKAVDENYNKSKFIFYVKRELEKPKNTKRAALVIGNADYKNSKLVNTLNDARDLSQKLQSFGFELYKYENVTSKSELEKAIISFCEKVKNFDLVVFYYSGHGVQLNGENYMVPTKATLNSAEVVKSYCVDINNVLTEMTGAQCKFKVIILDACRDNPFEKNWAGKSLKNNGKGLTEMSYSTNTLLMYATSPGSIASDNLSGRNGLFTQELLKNMDKDLTIDQIFKLTGKSVANISGNCQVPWISSSLFDDIYLKR